MKGEVCRYKFYVGKPPRCLIQRGVQLRTLLSWVESESALLVCAESDFRAVLPSAEVSRNLFPLCAVLYSAKSFILRISLENEIVDPEPTVCGLKT